MNRRQTFTALAVTALMLLASVPVVVADGGVRLDSVTADDFDATVPPGANTTVMTEYTLDLDVDRTLAFVSSVDPSTLSAEWVLDGASIGSTTDASPPGSLQQDVAAGSHDLVVRWSIPSSFSEGEYDLLVHIYEVQSGDGGQAAVSEARDLVSLTMDFVRTAPSSGGGGEGNGGGGGGGGGAGNGAPPESTPPSDPQDHAPGQSEGDGPERRQASAEEAESLRAAGIEADSETVFFSDSDGDGVVDRVDDQTGRIASEHAVKETGLIVVADTETGNLAVLDPATGEASPLVPVAESETSVQSLASRPADDTSGEEDVPQEELTEEIAVTVPKSTGWIKVSIPDPAPGKDITGLVRSDGLVLSSDNAWRSDGKVHFIDDPETTYVLTFTPPASSGLPWQAIVALAVVGVLVVASVVVMARRGDGRIWGRF